MLKTTKPDLLKDISDYLGRVKLKPNWSGADYSDLPRRISEGLAGAKQDSLQALSTFLAVILQQQDETDRLKVDLLNPEQIRTNMKAFAKVVMPWETDRDCKTTHMRKLATGQTVGLVTTRLGSFTTFCKPREHGWGVRGNGPSGYGSCIEGINKVEWDDSMSEEEIVAAEQAALEASKKEVDEFLRREYPDLTLLEEGE